MSWPSIRPISSCTAWPKRSAATYPPGRSAKRTTASFDLDELERLVRPDTKMIVINTPHNPTGAILSRVELKRIYAMAESVGSLVLCDEAYRWLDLPGRAAAGAADAQPGPAGDQRRHLFQAVWACLGCASAGSRPPKRSRAPAGRARLHLAVSGRAERLSGQGRACGTGRADRPQPGDHGSRIWTTPKAGSPSNADIAAWDRPRGGLLALAEDSTSTCRLLRSRIRWRRIIR